MSIVDSRVVSVALSSFPGLPSFPRHQLIADFVTLGCLLRLRLGWVIDRLYYSKSQSQQGFCICLLRSPPYIPPLKRMGFTATSISQQQQVKPRLARKL